MAHDLGVHRAGVLCPRSAAGHLRLECHAAAGTSRRLAFTHLRTHWANVSGGMCLLHFQLSRRSCLQIRVGIRSKFLQAGFATKPVSGRPIIQLVSGRCGINQHAANRVFTPCGGTWGVRTRSQRRSQHYQPWRGGCLRRPIHILGGLSLEFFFALRAAKIILFPRVFR